MNQNKNDAKTIRKDSFNFKPEDLQKLRMQFEIYSDEEDKIDASQFGLLMTQFFSSLKELSKLIFDAIKKEDKTKLKFNEFAKFFEELIGNGDQQNFKFSFRILTKNLSDSFNKTDLKNFLKEIQKLDKNSAENVTGFHYSPELNYCNLESELEELTDYVFSEFSQNGKISDISFERFSEVLENNDLIFLIFKSLNGGLSDLLLFKESEKDLKEFLEEVTLIENQIEDFLMEDQNYFQNSQIKRASSPFIEHTDKKDRKGLINLSLKKLNSVVSKKLQSKSSLIFSPLILK